MANKDEAFLTVVTLHVVGVLLCLPFSHTQNILVFQPSFLISTGPVIDAFLLGNSSDVSLNLRKVSPSNTTGNIGSPSCVPETTQWGLTWEVLGKTAVGVQLKLNQSLRLCGENDTNTDCCAKPLCVLEALQLSACVDGTPWASLLIQVKIHAQLVPANNGSDNKTVIPNQVYEPLGTCPCDLTLRVCDVRCCCDKDCSDEDLKLFASQCLPGPFGGQVSPVPDYQCSAQSSQNSPDWFPFLCVESPPENNPYLGLFYQGATIASKPGPSFQRPDLPTPVPVSVLIQGSPIFKFNDEFFTIPQRTLRECVNSAPVAFLENFDVKCVTLLRSCPTGVPLQTSQTDLSVKLRNGEGGDVVVEVITEVATDLSSFIDESNSSSSSDQKMVCENVTLVLDYKFYWEENTITGVTVRRTVGTVAFSGNVTLTTRYAAVFLNGEFIGEPNSGNPGYQVERPVIAGIINTSDNNTGLMERTSVNFWKPVSDGLCSTAEKKQILFGVNSTSGCLLPVSQHNLTQCALLRENVATLQTALITAEYVAKTGNPDYLTIADWVNITFDTLNSSTVFEETSGTCDGIPSHQHIQVWSVITSMAEGIPQREIHGVQVSYGLSTWTLDCGGGDVSVCSDPGETWLFSITSSVTFIDIPINTRPPKTRFQINYTEYDCNRNDVCWPELAFPITKYYTGEPYSLALAKGMILVFFFITASILGTPWRQIRQAWHGAAM
ncbi:tectonic-2 [Salarias fasciatus]|uniref:Uncharacterized protein n=1 Tax=Salarias fasciatus TaxID=181472 RepID=A0A672JSB0_SALFA|nr:tectonic-2 [Salarias fasciatus]